MVIRNEVETSCLGVVMIGVETTILCLKAVRHNKRERLSIRPTAHECQIGSPARPPSPNCGKPWKGLNWILEGRRIPCSSESLSHLTLIASHRLIVSSIQRRLNGALRRSESANMPDFKNEEEDSGKEG
jgi:hypothetical protein